MKKLRLLVTKECPLSCSGCCNNDWDLDNLGVFDTKTAADYSLIMITGGEPLLYPDRLIALITDIRTRSCAQIIIYTSTYKIDDLIKVLGVCDGITITLHNQEQIPTFYKLHNNLLRYGYEHKSKSLRLNVFDGVGIMMPPEIYRHWQVKDGIKWVKDCPLPENELFLRLPNLWQ